MQDVSSPPSRTSGSRPFKHVVTGDRGVSEWIFTGTTASGASVEVNGCDLFTFRNGTIVVKSSYLKNRAA
jgi:ketosteroid isomerase-like protein